MNQMLYALLILGGSALSSTAATQPPTTQPPTTQPPITQPSPNKAEQIYILRPSLDPARFGARVTNPWFPLTPGTRHVYQEKTPDGTRRIEVTVGRETRQIMGVTVREVRDRVTQDGQLVEDTLDWYAQDRAGNVWYFGEDTKEYKGGKVVSTAGTWKAGVEGAVPGIVMLADPIPGDTYRQEYWKGQAEDMGQVVGLRGKASVPYGTYENLLVIAEWNQLKPTELMYKSYAKGVGEVFKVAVQGGPETGTLMDIQRR